MQNQHLDQSDSHDVGHHGHADGEGYQYLPYPNSVKRSDVTR